MVDCKMKLAQSQGKGGGVGLVLYKEKQMCEDLWKALVLDKSSYGWWEEGYFAHIQGGGIGLSWRS